VITVLSDCVSISGNSDVVRGEPVVRQRALGSKMGGKMNSLNKKNYFLPTSDFKFLSQITVNSIMTEIC